MNSILRKEQQPILNDKIMVKKKPIPYPLKEEKISFSPMNGDIPYGFSSRAKLYYEQLLDSTITGSDLISVSTKDVLLGHGILTFRQLRDDGIDFLLNGDLEQNIQVYLECKLAFLEHLKKRIIDDISDY